MLINTVSYTLSNKSSTKIINSIIYTYFGKEELFWCLKSIDMEVKEEKEIKCKTIKLNWFFFCLIVTLIMKIL